MSADIAGESSPNMAKVWFILAAKICKGGVPPLTDLRFIRG